MILPDRYLSAEKCEALTATWKNFCTHKQVGISHAQRPIHQYQWGEGPTRVLLWSQMHGNEATTTRALLQFFDYLNTSAASPLFSALRLCVIPQLNPDGATVYTRENAQGIDLNRDAQNLIAPESKVLREVFDTFNPHWCFNLHDQRTIYSAGPQGPPASVSFLAPAADPKRTNTAARKQAMGVIATIHKALDHHLKGGMGRYDDTFNPNCVGDYFATQKVPTLLFEAGHFPGDYNRTTTTSYVFKALKVALQSIAQPNTILDYEHYFSIPENHTSYVDVLLKGVNISTALGTKKQQQLAIQYVDKFEDASIVLQPEVHSYGASLPLRGHREFVVQKGSVALDFNLKDSLQIAKNLKKLLGKHSF